MIPSFGTSDTERIWNGDQSRRFPVDLQKHARRRMLLLEAAETLDDLRNLPGNRLHALTKDRAGQHSISINKQYRICFVWKDGDAYDVELVDYHD
ncbi:MAG: type II toxin-antitoxin system RelE/ParE family toxin [Sphingomonadaceae bacterium]